MRARCTSVETLYYSIEMGWLNIYVPRLTLWIFDSTAPVPVKKNTQLKHTTASLLMKSKGMHYNEYLIPKKGKFVDSSLPKCEGRI